MTSDKGRYIISKGAVQEDTTLANMYVPNIGAPKYTKKILEDYKKEIGHCRGSTQPL